MSELLQTADAAQIAGVTPSAIHRAVQDARLRVEAVTPRGTRLFTLADVQKYRKVREAAQEKIRVRLRQKAQNPCGR